MCQLPSIRKWVRSVRSSASRMSMCLPRGTTSRTVAPVEVEGGQLRQPELAAAQGGAGQRGVHPLGGQPDGVSFGHATMIRCGSLRRRSAARDLVSVAASPG